MQLHKRLAMRYRREFVTSAPLSWMPVHAEPLRMRTNVVYFRVIRRLYTFANEIDYAWTSKPWKRTRGHGEWRHTPTAYIALSWKVGSRSLLGPFKCRFSISELLSYTTGATRHSATATHPPPPTRMHKGVACVFPFSREGVFFLGGRSLGKISRKRPGNGMFFVLFCFVLFCFVLFCFCNCQWQPIPKIGVYYFRGGGGQVMGNEQCPLILWEGGGGGEGLFSSLNACSSSKLTSRCSFRQSQKRPCRSTAAGSR